MHHTEAFVDGLYQLVLDNRPLLAALAGQVGDAQERIQSEFLQDVLDRVEREVTVETRVRGNETMDAAYAVRFAFALVYGVTILDDTLFPVGDRRPAQRDIVRQMAAYRRHQDAASSEVTGGLKTPPR